MEDGISGGLQHRHKTCCEKGGHCGRWACMVRKWSSLQGRCFQTGGLVYDNESTIPLPQSKHNLGYYV